MYKIIGEKQVVQNLSSGKNFDNPLEAVSEVSETAETIKELNSDELQVDKFSPIDLKTRLHSSEVSSIIAVDSLVAMEFLPSQTTFITRSKKRLAVSLAGKGREEIVAIAKGMDENSRAKSGFEKLGSWFRGN